MKLLLAVACLLVFGGAAQAQYGVSNARDGNGNLIRNTGMNPTRSFDQQPVNNMKKPIVPVDPAELTEPTTGTAAKAQKK